MKHTALTKFPFLSRVPDEFLLRGETRGDSVRAQIRREPAS